MTANNITDRSGWSDGVRPGAATFPRAATRVPRTDALRMSVVLCLALLSLGGLGQEKNANGQSVPLRDPSRPALVKVNVMNGSIHVNAHEDQNVQVESRPVNGNAGVSAVPGLNGAKGIKVEEEDNVVSMSTGPLAGAVDLYIQVPVKTSLKLACLQAGEITVEKVEGEIEASGLNGSVRLLDVSGVVVAHTLNGQVKVTFQRVAPDKPMSFSTLNGDVDVTLPANTRANVNLETLNGNIQSDFELQQKGLPGQTGKPGSPTVMTNEKVRSGAINGGGPEYRLKAFNGTIHLRKKGN